MSAPAPPSPLAFGSRLRRLVGLESLVAALDTRSLQTRVSDLL